jgi:hypothetical protein
MDMYNEVGAIILFQQKASTAFSTSSSTTELAQMSTTAITSSFEETESATATATATATASSAEPIPTFQREYIQV